MTTTNPNQASVQAITTAAQRYGIDPQAMVAVARVESGLNPKAIGDGGHAFGLFQFNNAGGVITGDPNPGKYLNPSYNALAAARHIATIKGIKGATGADAVKLIVQGFERPANQAAEIAKATAYLGPGAGVSAPTVGLGHSGVNSNASQTAPNGSLTFPGTTGSNTGGSPLERLLQYTMAQSSPQKSFDSGSVGSGTAGLMNLLTTQAPGETVPAPTVNMTPTAQASTTAATTGFTPSGGYSALTPTKYAGVDQGVDFTGSGPVRALADGVVTRVEKGGTGWSGQGAMVVYKLTSGPHAGQHVYMAEDLVPAAGLRPGAKVRAGQVLAQATGSGQAPGIEVGFAKDARGSAFGNVSDSHVKGSPTQAYGQKMANFISSLSKGAV